jgi:predicted TIM-barrel fold metal-dependent hydrolase
MLVIDAWIQHPTAKMLEDPLFELARHWTGRESLEIAPLEDTIATLDAGKISGAVITACHGPQGALVTNDEVASFVASFPDRLIGVAAIDLMRPVEAVRELRRAVRQLGLRGLRILPWLWGLPPNDRHYYPLYAECVELGVPCCLHVGHTGPMRASEPGRPIPYLDEVALDFPELVIVGGNLGYPWTAELIDLATKYRNVFIDTSAWMPSRFPPELVSYLRGYGRRKVLFASSYPTLAPGACISEVDSLGLDDEARRLYLGENAARVFRLG